MPGLDLPPFEFERPLLDRGREDAARNMAVNQALAAMAQQRAEAAGLPLSSLTPGPIGAAATEAEFAQRRADRAHEMADKNPLTALNQQNRIEDLQIQRSARLADDPRFQKGLQVRQQEGVLGAINTNPNIVSSLLANQRNRESIQSREGLQRSKLAAQAELEQLSQAAATGRTQMTTQTQERIAQLRATIQLADMQLGQQSQFPETFFGMGGGVPEAQMGTLQGAQDAVSDFGAPINTGPALPAPGANVAPSGNVPGTGFDTQALTPGQQVQLDDGSTATVVQVTPQGVVIEDANGARELVQ